MKSKFKEGQTLAYIQRVRAGTHVPSAYPVGKKWTVLKLPFESHAAANINYELNQAMRTNNRTNHQVKCFCRFDPQSVDLRMRGLRADSFVFKRLESAFMNWPLEKFQLLPPVPSNASGYEMVAKVKVNKKIKAACPFGSRGLDVDETVRRFVWSLT